MIMWHRVKRRARGRLRVSVCLQAEREAGSRLRASEAPVHEGHVRPAVSAEPAHQNPEEMRRGRERRRLLPVRSAHMYFPHGVDFQGQVLPFMREI